MKNYDITFVGHMCYDEIIPFQGKSHVAPGSAVLCGAVVPARIGKKVAAITKMSPKDEPILDAIKKVGVDVYLIPAAETGFVQVIHPSANVDERRLVFPKNAGPFQLAELPEFKTRFLHLAGISAHEFTLEFMTGLKQRGYDLSVDMQSFVRQINPVTKEIVFADDPNKQKIVSLMSKVKLDIVEAKVLTGTDNLENAAIIFEKWGCPEVVITQAEGVLSRVNGKTYYEKFSNRSVIGRTGRGDTTFAAYLSYRMDHDVPQSLKFAAALVSLKMEAIGPFAGTLDDVLKRMAERHLPPV
jgi:sugar/nucleoside kinase (ribokinase family)